MAFNFFELSPRVAERFKSRLPRLIALAPFLTDTYGIRRGTTKQIISTLSRAFVVRGGRHYASTSLNLDVGLFRRAFHWFSASERDKQATIQRLQNSSNNRDRDHAELLMALRADGLHTWQQVLDAKAAKESVAAPATPAIQPVPNEPIAIEVVDDGAWEPEPIERRIAALGEELLLLATEQAAALDRALVKGAAQEAQISFLKRAVEEANQHTMRAQEELLASYSATLEQIAAASPAAKELLAAAAELHSKGRSVRMRRVRMGLPLRFVWTSATGRIEYSEHFLEKLDRLQAVDIERVKRSLSRFASPDVGPNYPSFQTEKIRREGRAAFTPAGASKSRISDELRFTWTHPSTNTVIIHYMWRKGENVGLGEGEA